MGIVRISGLLFLVTLLGLASCGVAKPSGDSRPFARIAIHRARIALEKSSYVTATPTLLGFGGKTSQWETISFSSQNASNNDWIADFSPASAVNCFWRLLCCGSCLQSLWSLSLAINDIYALLVKRCLRNSQIVSLFAIGDGGARKLGYAIGIGL
ncbi:CASP-like protein 5A3 isoform X1 [Macadamia integrifolia]|uniref:CASP-like protein 5A3 isoform X1 n=1 Tax=Macadamia integrifolia TaxID=60698 RepID=UPI001C528E90|nr:CASP-like protein 5A3 isoform X1 [Macadamia integrifolia]XP_042477969.1 CASP-like protein 5A3 isoform X1 [Macadamia integrifolia]